MIWIKYKKGQYKKDQFLEDGVEIDQQITQLSPKKKKKMILDWASELRV